MKKGQCKLCLKHKELCKESHIIPRFLYKFLMGENNSLVFVDDEKVATRFNGEYEGGILCKKCDSEIIGKLEDYAAKFMHGKLSSRLENIDGEEFLIIDRDKNYNYKKHKLFLLSLLWRSSISSRPFFNQIKLSRKDEENLREMILNDSPGEPDIYPCFLHLPPLITSPEGDRGFHILHMQTMSPITAKNAGWEICKFIIQGMNFYYIITKPTGTKVEPSVEKNKISLKFSTLDKQSELFHQTIEMVKNHKR